MFQTEIRVRAYECDMQQHVNNARYLHYLEFAREQIMKEIGVSFADLYKQGKMAVVIRLEIDYRKPLKADDVIVVKSNVKMDGNVKFMFKQDIFKIDGDKPTTTAKVYALVLENGIPIAPKEIIDAINAIKL